MTVQETDQDPSHQVEAASKAFEQEFERFASFTGDPNGLVGLTLDEAVAQERSLSELRTRHLGKKSALAAAKKLIGRVPSDQRAAFGQPSHCISIRSRLSTRKKLQTYDSLGAKE